MKRFTIIVDNGHGQDTAGKRSPDGILREWAWNRDCAGRVVETLKSLGHNVVLLVPEDNDIPLKERCRRANEICNREGAENVILVSVHANAFGDGKEFNSAAGWSIWTSPGKTKSDEIATTIFKRAVRTWGEGRCRAQMIDGDPDYEDSFYILIHTVCPAVLVENFFYTNKKDYNYLLSPASIYECSEVMARGIQDYIDALQ